MFFIVDYLVDLKQRIEGSILSYYVLNFNLMAFGKKEKIGEELKAEEIEFVISYSIFFEKQTSSKFKNHFF